MAVGFARRPLVVTAIASLGCGGIWSNAVGDAMIEDVRLLDAQLATAADGPNKLALEGLLDQAKMAAHTGRIGLWESVLFQTAVEDALADGVIEDWEFLNVKRTYDQMIAS